MDGRGCLLADLVANGVRDDVVLSPGSRSQALALAAVRFADDGHVRVHVRIDERVAGFTALGIARETGVPAAVICTSGTAVANLLPAVAGGFPRRCPAAAADRRPSPELRGVGANQATRQEGLFHPWVRDQIDAPVPGDVDWADSPSVLWRARWERARSMARCPALRALCT